MPVRIDTEIQYLKGVGPRLGTIFKKRGLSTVMDLLEYYPRAYEDRRVARRIADLVPDEIVSLKAQVVKVSSFNMGRSKRKIYEILLRDESGQIRCKFFRVPYRGYFERFETGTPVRVVGKVTDYRGRIEFHHPDVHAAGEDTEEELDQLIPIYTESDGLNSRKMRRIVLSAFENLVPFGVSLKEAKPLPLHKLSEAIVERLPDWVLKKYNLPCRARSLLSLHSPPKDPGEGFTKGQSDFHRRIIFEEFFWLELFLAARKKGFKSDSAVVMRREEPVIEKFIESLPFELTEAQKRVFSEIWTDLGSGHPMNRLVQGDVGSGKTMIALLSVVVAAANGFQSAIMAPTEILCLQHLKNTKKFLEPLGLEVALLTGSMKAKERREVLEKLQLGRIHVLVGTHALLQGDVEFEKLGLVVIDEQHRFGVHQRADLKNKGKSPHFLIMTATPIPRTLAMTVYGDLDVSIIDQLPAGRQPIVTRVTFQSKRPKVLQFMKEQIQKGRQAYFIFPLVEESEKIDLQDAVSAHEGLVREFPEIRFGILHGRMKPEEKEQIMTEFREHRLDVLVSTTVVEVGVDVPNSNMIIVMHAERFGLSQLHQLRGRVGRGSHKSYCVLILGHAVSEESRHRAQLMEKNADGFKIAEADLELRGPGEFLGSRQSGLPGFKMANLVRDVAILQEARQAAFDIIRRDPELSSPEHALLRAELLQTHGATALASIG